MIVLVADDDLLTRHIVSAIVRAAGYTALEAEDGLQAWEAVCERDVSLLLTDWEMPGLDGPALIQRIRAAHLPRYVFCTLLTVRGAQGDRLSGLGAGADDYLVKPVDPAELRARLAIAARIIALERNLRAANVRLEAIAAQLHHQATHDPLTGVLNRLALNHYGVAELERARRNRGSFAVALLDVDHFKQVNDRFGHSVGDSTLVFVASQIRAVVRPQDRVGRWGGEEFLIILPDASAEEARAVAERVRLQIAGGVLRISDHQAVTVSASVGVTSTADGAGTLDRLVIAADRALYLAKQHGRNLVCYDDGAA